jgi:hypothetical protein
MWADADENPNKGSPYRCSVLLLSPPYSLVLFILRCREEDQEEGIDYFVFCVHTLFLVSVSFLHRTRIFCREILTMLVSRSPTSIRLLVVCSTWSHVLFFISLYCTTIIPIYARRPFISHPSSRVAART